MLQCMLQCYNSELGARSDGVAVYVVVCVAVNCAVYVAVYGAVL